MWDEGPEQAACVTPPPSSSPPSSGRLCFLEELFLQSLPHLQRQLSHHTCLLLVSSQQVQKQQIYSNLKCICRKFIVFCNSISPQQVGETSSQVLDLFVIGCLLTAL